MRQQANGPRWTSDPFDIIGYRDIVIRAQDNRNTVFLPMLQMVNSDGDFIFCYLPCEIEKEILAALVALAIKDASKLL